MWLKLVIHWPRATFMLAMPMLSNSIPLFCSHLCFGSTHREEYMVHQLSVSSEASSLPFLQFSFSILSYHACYSYNSCISCLKTCSFFKVFFFGRVTEIKKIYVRECLPASMSMCPIHAVPKDAKRGHQIPWTWSYRWGQNWGLVEEQQVLLTTK